MSVLSEEVREKVIKSRDLMREAIEAARPDTTKDLDYASREDQLRFYLFVSCMEDAIKGTHNIAKVCEMSDEDYREMCAKADITLTEAVLNARMNLMCKAIDIAQKDNHSSLNEEEK